MSFIDKYAADSLHFVIYYFNEAKISPNEAKLIVNYSGITIDLVEQKDIALGQKPADFQRINMAISRGTRDINFQLINLMIGFWKLDELKYRSSSTDRNLTSSKYTWMRLNGINHGVDKPKAFGEKWR